MGYSEIEAALLSGGSTSGEVPEKNHLLSIALEALGPSE